MKINYGVWKKEGKNKISKNRMLDIDGNFDDDEVQKRIRQEIYRLNHGWNIHGYCVAPNDKHQSVLNFINKNFELSAIQIKPCNLLSFGQIVTDQQGDQMLVYYDLLTDKVKYKLPGE